MSNYNNSDSLQTKLPNSRSFFWTQRITLSNDKIFDSTQHLQKVPFACRNRSVLFRERKTKTHSRVFFLIEGTVFVDLVVVGIVGIDDELVFLVECSMRFVSFLNELILLYESTLLVPHHPLNSSTHHFLHPSRQLLHCNSDCCYSSFRCHCRFRFRPHFFHFV